MSIPKRAAVIFALPLFFFALPALGATGFVESPLWLSPEKPKEGENVTLSAVFRNGEPATLTGRISFYDGDTLLAERAIVIPANQVGTASVTFRMESGRHEFSAVMAEAATLGGGGSKTALAVADTKVALPQTLVPKNFLTAKADDAGSADSASQREILDQVDKAEQAVLDLLPEPVKEKVSEAAATVEDWRTQRSANYAETRDDAKLEIQKEKLEAERAAVKSGSAAKPESVSPLARLKLLTFSALALLFSPLLFYALLGLMAFLLLRFIFLKVFRVLRFKRSRGPGRPKKTEVPKK